MVLLGSIANALAIIIGGVVGSVAKKGIPERYGNLLISALGILTMVIGITFAIKTQDLMVVLFSIIIGAVLGEWIDIEKRLDNLGERVQSKLKGLKGNFSQGFVTSSLLFCVGSMAIMGSLQSGLSNNHEILFAKSIMDGIISVVFASTMGIGVAASSVPVFIYQGAITLLAAVAAPYLSEAVITEMTATGGILLIALCLNILDIKKIKVGNLLPAVFIPIILMQVMALFK